VDFNFTVAKKMDKLSMIPNDSLRVKNSYIVIAANIAEIFKKLQPELGVTGRIKIQIGADPQNQAIQLVPTDDDRDEFTFRIQESGVAQGNLPSALKRMKMPRGEYGLVRDIELPHVYRYKEGWSHVPEEEIPKLDPEAITKGSFVTWRARLKDVTFTSEGIVEEIVDLTFGGKVKTTKKAARIYVTSKEYILNAHKKHTNVSLDKLNLKKESDDNS
jgi:hypothetical protein